MLEKKFKTWPTNLISNATLLIFGMHVINLSYLEDKPLYFTKFLDGGMKKSNKTLEKLDNTTAISNNDNKYLPDLPDLKAKWAKKKEKNAQKC